MELRCLSWRTVWFWRAHILIVIIDFGSGFFCCKVVLVLEGEVWQLITQHSRILSLSINVGKKKKKKKQNTIPINANHTIARQNVKTLWKGHCSEKNIYTCVCIYIYIYIYIYIISVTICILILTKHVAFIGHWCVSRNPRAFKT